MPFAPLRGALKAYGRFVAWHAAEVAVLSLLLVALGALPFFARVPGLGTTSTQSARLEQISAATAHAEAETAGVLDPDALTDLMVLRNMLAAALADAGALSAGTPLLSVFDCWNNSAQQLRDDPDVRATIAQCLRSRGWDDSAVLAGARFSGPGGELLGAEAVVFTYALLDEHDEAQHARAGIMGPLSRAARARGYSLGVVRGGASKLLSIRYFEQDAKSSEVLLLITANVITVLYVYFLLLKLLRLGSRYSLGLAALFTAFGSFVVSAGIFHALGMRLTLVVSAAIPFLFFVLGMESAYHLSKHALQPVAAGAPVSAPDRLGSAMAVCGEQALLDAASKTLILSVGAVSGVPALRDICLFGALSVAIAYALLMTFFAAVLARKVHLAMAHGPFKTAAAAADADGDTLSPLATRPGTPERTAVASPDALATVADPMEWNGGLGNAGHDNAGNAVSERFKVVLVVGLLGMHAANTMHLGKYLLGSHEDDAIVQAFQGLNIASLENRTYELAPPTKIVLSRLGAAAGVGLGAASPLLSCQPYFSPALCAVLDWIAQLVVDGDGDPVASRLGQHMLVAIVSALVAVLAVKYALIDARLPRLASATSANLAAAALSPTPSASTISVMPSAASGAVPTVDPTPADPPPTPAVCFEVGADEDEEEQEDNAEEGGAESQSGSGTAASAAEPRPLSECVAIAEAPERGGYAALTDDELVMLVDAQRLQLYKLEEALGDLPRAVGIRRRVVMTQLLASTTCEDPEQGCDCLDGLPYTHYDYSRVLGACCENVVGYVPIPVGVAGPLKLDGHDVVIPMATTEGCLVASTHRGCKALNECGGVCTAVMRDSMTRGPVLRLPSAIRAAEVRSWIEQPDHAVALKAAFDSTSRYARLQGLQCTVAGSLLFVRFCANTGDAMGMNMISKGAEKALEYLQQQFSDLQVISLSGNYCTDKKPAAINWIEGRGKSVVSEAVLTGDVAQRVLKTSVAALCELNISKNLIGSAMAGSVGGFNAHAANIVTAIYLATGQDPAQNVESSNCITIIEPCNGGRDARISCTMPSIEVGTVGGGTVLPGQAACLELLGVRGAHATDPGQNARKLARVVCGAVLAGELSLLSALAAGHLVRSHMKHNRSNLNLLPSAPTSQPVSRKPSLHSIEA